MQSKNTKKPVIQEVKKPIIQGSWHGKDVWKLAGKRVLSIIGITFIYLIAGLLLSFDSLVGRSLACAAVVFIAAYYQYAQGMAQGENEASFGEIMYSREQEGRTVTEEDREKCFHPMKGFFATLVALIPFMLFALVFAVLTKPSEYTLGILPSWTDGLLMNSEFGDSLAYYDHVAGFQAIDVMRIIDRALVMPFINVAAYIGDNAALLVERLSPLLLTVAPLGYGLGYAQGVKIRTRINTGIKMGDDKKKRKERKARKKRQRSNTPERLI